jgi:hypothetical protein
MWRNVAKTLRELWRTSAASAGAYRPDRHYMRGPGPKWHAKYGNLAAKPVASAPRVHQVLNDTAEHHA